MLCATITTRSGCDSLKTNTYNIAHPSFRVKFQIFAWRPCYFRILLVYTASCNARPRGSAKYNQKFYFIRRSLYICVTLFFPLQMGDTVKKSRIVSDGADADENLEESLMEEFNLRLKSCMSQVCIFCAFALIITVRAGLLIRPFHYKFLL